MQRFAENVSSLGVSVFKIGVVMTYLLLSNLILVIVPMLLMFASKTTKYPEKLDLFFTVLTFFIIVFGFIPEHMSSMTLNNLLLLVAVFLVLEIME